MTKVKKNLWIDVALFTAMLLLASTGLIMKYALPSEQGQGRGAKGEESRLHLGRTESGEHGEGRGEGRETGKGRHRNLELDNHDHDEPVRGQGQKEEWLGLTRHEFGDIHFVLAVTFLAVLILHFILHWSWITCRVKELFRKKTPPAECEVPPESA